jgi:hypothetical protein
MANTFHDAPWDGKGVNFMTPRILKRGRSGDWAWELSEGTGLEHEPIFGATFRLWDGKRWTDPEGDVSRLFFDRAEAKRYIGEVTQ